MPPPPRPSSTTAGVDFVKKASLSRLKAAVDEVLGNPDPSQQSGFDIAVTSKPKRGLFKKADDKIRLLVKFVPLVDAEAVAEVWVGALKGKVADAILCVLLVGSGLAPVQGPGHRDQRAAPEVPQCRSCAGAGRCERLGGTVSPGYAVPRPGAHPAPERGTALSRNRSHPFA